MDVMNNSLYLDDSIKELLDELPAMVAWYNLDMRLAWANKRLVHMLEKPLEYLAGKTCREIWRLAQADISDYPVAKAKQSKQVEEKLVLSGDGCQWSVRASPVFDKEGELIAISEVIRDISHTKQESFEAGQTEQPYLAFIEAANNLALVVDEDYRVQSAWGKRINEYPIKPGDFAEEVFKNLYPCPEGENIRVYCQRVFESGESFSIECAYEFNGVSQSDLFFIFPVVRKHTRVEQVGILCRDITARKNAQMALQESEKTLKDIIEFLPDATFVIDRQGKVLAWNRAIEQMTGIAKEEMLGQGDYVYAVPFYGEKRPILINLVFEENSPLKDQYPTLKQYGKTLAAEVFLSKLNQGKGTHFWVTATPLYNHKGEIVGSIESIRDISEHKEAENQLKTALAEKEALLRELYHRTKNNMQMISSMLSLQADFINDAQIVGVFKDMGNRIRSMSLVHQRLYQSRNLSSIDLGEYLNELIGLLLQSYNARPDMIEIALEAEPVTVFIDTAIPCGLIINELVSNSLKYAFPGDRTGKITISLSKTAENDIMLAVSDNGVGALPDFDPRTHGKLGMQIVLALGEQQLSGKVSFELEHGFSSKVRFPFPLENSK